METSTEKGPEMEPLVLRERQGAVEIVTINRPRVHNCIDAETARELNDLFDELEGDEEVRVVILRGAGPSFSTGLDLKALARQGPALIAKVIFEKTGWAGIGKRFFPKPLIAAVHGYALAGGLELALSCDFIIAAEDAKLGFNEATLGPIADAGGCFRLPKWVPLPLAREMLMTGRPISAQRAYEAGLVNHVVPREQLTPATLEIAQTIATNSIVSMSIMKRLIAETLDRPEDEAWTINDRYMRQSMETAAFMEGPTAFAERRRPEFSGR